MFLKLFSVGSKKYVFSLLLSFILFLSFFSSFSFSFSPLSPSVFSVQFFSLSLSFKYTIILNSFPISGVELLIHDPFNVNSVLFHNSHQFSFFSLNLFFPRFFWRERKEMRKKKSLVSLFVSVPLSQFIHQIWNRISKSNLFRLLSIILVLSFPLSFLLSLCSFLLSLSLDFFSFFFLSLPLLRLVSLLPSRDVFVRFSG